MPLNLNDPEDSSLPQNRRTEPVFHEPSEPASRFPLKWILLGLGLLIVLGGGYYGWTSGFFSSLGETEPARIVMNSDEQPKGTESSPPAASTQPQAAPSQPFPEPKITPAPAVRETPPARNGRYTIYISRQLVQWRADEEAGRWRAAGYEAIVREEQGWYKLSIGRYATWEEARAAASDLQDGFEAGYWVSTIVE